MTFDDKYELASYFETRGRIKFNLGRFEESISDFEESISLYDFLDEKTNTTHYGEKAVCFWQITEINIKLKKFDSALISLIEALNYALLDREEALYFRLQQELAWIYWQLDKTALAVRVCNDAINYYEINSQKPYDSYIYFGILMLKTSIMVWLELWENADESLNKIQSIDDYFVPMNRAIRVDSLRAQTLHGLGDDKTALELLNSVLGDELGDKVTDEDLADCFELRGKILLAMGNYLGTKDLMSAINFYNSHNDVEKINELQNLIEGEK